MHQPIPRENGSRPVLHRQACFLDVQAIYGCPSSPRARLPAHRLGPHEKLPNMRAKRQHALRGPGAASPFAYKGGRERADKISTQRSAAHRSDPFSHFVFMTGPRTFVLKRESGYIRPSGVLHIPRYTRYTTRRTASGQDRPPLDPRETLPLLAVFHFSSSAIYHLSSRAGFARYPSCAVHASLNEKGIGVA